MLLRLDCKFYFVGIGGIGMSSLALYLSKKGCVVAGSDRAYSDILKTLQLNGVDAKVGSYDNLIKNYDVIVYSSAINDQNLEIVAAKKLNKILISRAELLSSILSCYRYTVGVAGTHGKTTATCMLSHIFTCASVPITSFIGGIDLKFNNLISNGIDTAISEVCEYKGNVDKINSYVAVVLNVDNDHLDYYKTFDNLKSSFINFLQRSEYKIINADDEVLKNYKSKNVISYGVNASADYKAEKLRSVNGKYIFDVYKRDKKYLTVKLDVYGKHNVYNALSAIAVCDYVFKIDKQKIIDGLYNYKGCLRRMEYLGKYLGVDVIADYCHHPKEIEKTLDMAKEKYGGDYLTLFQPHTYSRTKLLFDDFKEVFKDENVVFYKTYSAREDFDEQGSVKRLAFELSKNYVEKFESVKSILLKNKNVKALFILGAGDLYDIVKKKLQK